MPKYNTYLGKIRNASPLADQMAKPLMDKERSMTVDFEGSWKGILKLDYPRAVVWAKMLDFLQKNNRPVWVEIDPDTNVIARLHIPQAARVLDIDPQEEVVNVTFKTSHAIHYLRRNIADFQKFLDLLQSSRDTDTTIMVTAVSHEFEIIDVRPLPPSFGIDGPPEPPPPPVPDPPVSPDRATELFNLMKAEGCTPCASVSTDCITFKYPYDGCWIRAHIMCYMMMDMGETPEKVWINGSLHPFSANVPECTVGWGWHVAPTLMVTQTSGPDIKMVIDPSLCEGPVTPDEWKALQSATATLSYTTWDLYYGSTGSGSASRSQANADLDQYRLYLDDMCAMYGPSPYACPILKRTYFIVDRSTISQDEVDAMLTLGNPAVIEAAFYIVVEGFTPTELNITNSTLSGVPNIVPTLSVSPSVLQMAVEVMPTIMLEYPTHFNRRQRITWKYKISFTGSAGFTAELTELTLNTSISTVSSTGKIYLIRQPNPYEIDGQTSWLSTDLRVFQIRTGETRFNKLMAADPSDFITTAISNLSSGSSGGDTFENILTDQQASALTISQSIGGVNVYNFAIAKVRYRALSVSATNVRVFFRLFPASSTSLEYNLSTTYRRNTGGGQIRPLLGINSGEAVTIPCFAAPRVDTSSVSMTQQTDPANVQTIPPNAGGQEVVRYFGCWLDINQTTPQFPYNPSPADGPWAMGRVSVMDHIRNEHQCLVAEIAFDPTPVPANASPSTSDKLAQRNLAIVASDNPGGKYSHRIPHTFEIKPTRAKQAPDELPDELMIDWGNTPMGCLATIYISGINTNDVMSLAARNYRSYTLVRIDEHTLQCETAGVTYIPIPPGEGAHYASMISIDLPDTVKKGQHFKIVVHQVTHTEERPNPTINKTIIVPGQRRILGSFQIAIPVTVKEKMLTHEEVLLSNLRWIQRSIPATNRWFDVFNRYVKQIGDRVDALGGDSTKVVASPSDDWKTRYQKCKTFGILVIILLALLILLPGVFQGQQLAVLAAALFIVLIGVVLYWVNNCKPPIRRILTAVVLGIVIGVIALVAAMLIL